MYTILENVDFSEKYVRFLKLSTFPSTLMYLIIIPPLVKKIVIRSLVRRIFRILARPFEAVRADDKVSRRDGCIAAGRVRLYVHLRN